MNYIYKRAKIDMLVLFIAKNNQINLKKKSNSKLVN